MYGQSTSCVPILTAVTEKLRRNVVIGTLEEYPTEELAQAAVNGLRMCINEDRNRQPQQAVFVSDLSRTPTWSYPPL